MEIFGFPLQTFIFNLFLPFLLFYLIIYALLTKSKILGEPRQANAINSLLALTISAISILSLYSLGLTVWLPYIAGITIVSAFVGLFIYGTLSYTLKKGSQYKSGEAFKTEDEKKFDAGLKNCNTLWSEFEKEKDEKKRAIISRNLSAEIAKLEPLATKLGKSLYVYPWYKEYRQQVAALGEKGA